MYLARVIGRVVATHKLEGLVGQKLLLVRPLDEQGDVQGPAVVACDVVHSGLGDIVHVADGKEAAMALDDSFVPVDATIVGHVEQFAHDGQFAHDDEAAS